MSEGKAEYIPTFFVFEISESLNDSSSGRTFGLKIHPPASTSARRDDCRESLLIIDMGGLYCSTTSLTGAAMLHAINGNKSKLYERYLGVRTGILDDSVSGNTTAEDEITSTLFGPLEFMTPSDVWSIAKILLGDAAPKEVDPKEFKLEFWNKLKTENENYIEPDAELIFFQDRKPIVAILLELKWNAFEGKDKDGKYQLDKQWEGFNKYLEGKFRVRGEVLSVYHLFIAKEPAVKNVVEDREQDARNENLICLTWDAVRAALETVAVRAALETVGEGTYSHAVYKWAFLANKFLELATATRPFGGFGLPSTEKTPEGFGAYPEIEFSKLSKRPLFWGDH